MEIFKTFTFDAAHKLPNLPKDHKCSRLHGHTFVIEIHVKDKMNSQMGWVIDFHEIVDIVKPIVDQLDHQYLNEIDGLDNPTSENIAKWLWFRIFKKLPILKKIVVKESPYSGVCFTGD